MRRNRSPIQIARDRRIIAELYCKGYSQKQIAEQLGLSRELVAYDISRIKGEWKATMISEFDEKIRIELAKLDAMESECWEAWERSTQTFNRRIYRCGGNQEQEDERVEEDRCGDPRFLDQIHKCIERRVRLLGLNPPELTSDLTPSLTIVIDKENPGGVDGDSIPED